MDFSYTEEQQMLQEQCRKFIGKSYDFDSRKAIIDSEAGFSAEHWALFAQLGWLTVPFSEADGGFGGRAVDLMVIMEEFGRGMVVEPFLPSAILGGGMVAALGTAEQKAAMLPPLMEGKLLLSLAYAEADSRYDLGRVATTAKSKGKETILDGTKVAVLGGGSADKLLVVARESGGVSERKGISVFIVDATAAGLKRQEYTTVDGRRAAQVTLKNVKVAAADRLGGTAAAGKALLALEQVIDRGALAVSAQAVGAMQTLLHKTVEYTKTRKQFGVPIAAFQALQHRMVDMFMECELARSIVTMAAMKLDSDVDARQKARAVSAAKSRVGRAIDKVGQEAVQIHGGVGVSDELDVAHLFKSVTVLDVLFGDADYHSQRFAALTTDADADAE